MTEAVPSCVANERRVIAASDEPAGDRGTSDESRFLAAGVDADAAVVSPVLLRPPERAMSAEAAPRAAWVMGLLALVGFMP